METKILAKRARNALWIALILAPVLASGACRKNDSDGSLKISPDYLNLTGSVLGTDGIGAPDVSVLIDRGAGTLATSGEFGTFKLNLSNSVLSRIAKTCSIDGKKKADSFRIVVEQGTGATLVSGASAPVSIRDRGAKSLGEIRLGAPANLSGKVVIVSAASSFSPASGVTVGFGCERVVTDTDGRFAFKNIPAGGAPVTAIHDGFAPSEMNVILAPGESRDMEDPLIIYGEGIVAGRVKILPQEDIGELIAAGHPFRRSFSVEASPSAKFVRYADDKAQFDGEKATAWIAIPSKLDYDFPKNGGQTLYVQFSDGEKQNFSEIYSNTVTVDIFAKGAGIVIEDGSGIVRSRTVTVHLDLAPGQTKMRMAESLAYIQALETWQKAEATTEFTFASSPVAEGSKTLFVQFATDSGDESTVYRASVVVQLFPSGNNVFKINNGATTTNDRVVRLDITLPPNATQMMVSETAMSSSSSGMGYNGSMSGMDYSSMDPATAAYYASMGSMGSSYGGTMAGQWVIAQPVYYHTFTSYGAKTLFLTFKDRDGVASSTYFQDITVDPFPPTPIGFVINNGAGVSPTRELTLSLTPPPGAMAFRFGESATMLMQQPWMPLTGHIPYLAQATGMRTIYLQYRNFLSDISLTYAQTTMIDPWLPGSGDFQILGCPAVGVCGTALALLDLAILAPLAATEMAISEGYPPSENSAGWANVCNHAQIRLNGMGIKTIYVRFRTIGGDVSPVIARSVLFDPFPPMMTSISVAAGAPVTETTNVNVRLTVPPEAACVKLSTNPNALEGQPCQAFPLPPGQMRTFDWPMELPERTTRQSFTVFALFQTLDGDRSNLFQDQIMLDLFPENSRSLTVEGGADETADPNVNLTLVRPTAAVWMKIAETLAELEVSGGLQPAASTATLTLSAGLGVKHVWVKWLTAAGTESVPFGASIKIVGP